MNIDHQLIFININSFGVYMACVYLLRDSITNLIKIGRATNLEKRLADLKTANPRLEVAHIFDGINAVKIEGYLHRRFGIHQQDGEYFDVPIKEVIDYGNSVINDTAILADPQLNQLELVESTGPIDTATNTDWDLINKLTQIDSEISQLTIKREILLSKLRLRIGTSSGIENLATWKLQKTSRFNQTLFKQENNELFKSYLKTSMSRVLKYHRFL